LKRFSVHRTSLEQIDPSNGNLIPFAGIGDSVIEAKGAAGVAKLLRLAVVTDDTRTVCCPVGGDIFRSVKSREGPAPNQIGNGGLDSSIRWGVVTGWTISGSFFCRSDPAVFCTIASGVDDATVDPPLRSAFYDLGTWSFHGTGFTATPFVYNRFTFGGNEQWILRGGQRDRFLPALSQRGLAALAACLLVLGALASRRPRRRLR